MRGGRGFDRAVLSASPMANGGRMAAIPIVGSCLGTRDEGVFVGAKKTWSALFCAGWCVKIENRKNEMLLSLL